VDHEEGPEDPAYRVKVDAVPMQDVFVVVAVFGDLFDATDVRDVIFSWVFRHLLPLRGRRCFHWLSKLEFLWSLDHPLKGQGRFCLWHLG
jgi:hypothetical protein